MSLIRLLYGLGLSSLGLEMLETVVSGHENKFWLRF